MALPVSQLWATSVRGVLITGAELLLVALVLVGAIVGLRAVTTERSSVPPVDPGVGSALLPGLLFAGFAIWVALAGFWSVAPQHALVKGLLFLLMAAGMVALGSSGLDWRRAVDAWLAGALITVLLTWAAVFLAPSGLQDRLVLAPRAIDLVPIPHLRGPFLSGTMFADYLTLTGALLWCRWDDYRARMPRLAVGGAVLLGLTLATAPSSSWVGAGVLLALLGLTAFRQRGGPMVTLKRPFPAVFVVVGAVLMAGTTVAMLSEVNLGTGLLGGASRGIWPDIWASAWASFSESPLSGIGASSYLATAVDPLDPDLSVRLWDAHSTYLSLLAQYGLVGFAIFAVAVTSVLRAVLRSGVSRVRISVTAALAIMAVQGIFSAGEEFRHYWALTGIALLVGYRQSMRVVPMEAEEVAG